MTIFSKHFNLNKCQYELDFVDIDTERDCPLYIDPFAISINNDDWSYQCNLYIVSFFQAALDYIRDGSDKEAQELLNNLNEPNETCLGLSLKQPQGKGVSGKQAIDIYNKLSESKAAKTGLLSELSDCDLFIEGIGHDKISDITTNIIRKLLIEYTKNQCELHNIKLSGKVASGKLWDVDNKKWHQDYVELPVINNKKIILVPKSIVRFKLSLEGREYYNHFVLNFLQQENLNSNSGLVRILKNGARKVYKKDLKNQHPFDKEWLAEFSKNNPSVLIQYKESKKSNLNESNLVENNDLNDQLDEASLAKLFSDSLKKIQPGPTSATIFHSYMIGVIEFIFWPNLIYPQKEHEIHEGRKRIDMIYTNAAKNGFFYRIHTAHHISSNLIMVECKNYNNEIKNPELDQLSGRFSINRGKFGILLYRDTDDYEELLIRCKDTASDGRGFIIPLGDKQILEMLSLIQINSRDKVDYFLDNIFSKIIS
ncbi:hypothetical protein AYO45_03520 [Gammaproteobacteria bacterium SCGC AG-212-F23]|nr:hypothetical protein AYO45_03520 [Gammaproteobacteria bacterium SCGC AG-212-F23]